MDWLEKGIFDALQKKYLQTVLLEVFEELAVKRNKKKAGVRRKLLECYTFTVTYFDGQAQLALAGDENDSTTISKERIKQTTGEVLQSLVHIASSLDPLPSSKIISMKVCWCSLSLSAFHNVLLCLLSLTLHHLFLFPFNYYHCSHILVAVHRGNAPGL